MTLFLFFFQLLFVPVFSPLVIGVVRKIKAIMQNRHGAPITQPYFDLWKLFHKDEVLSKDASWVFRWAPFIIFSIMLVLPLGVPLLATAQIFPYLSDFLVVIYLTGLMTFFLALAGIDVGSAFGGFGSSREMTLTALTEGAFVFSLLPMAFLAHSTNLVTIAASTISLSPTLLLPLFLSSFSFMAVLLAETKRFPFDNPSTHLELTMIHEAMILEYSGKRLALMEWAGFSKFLFFIVMGVNLFFPWTLITATLGTLNIWMLLISAAGLFLKILSVAAFVAVLESSIAKFRFFRLPDILLTAYIFGVIALVVAAI